MIRGTSLLVNDVKCEPIVTFLLLDFPQSINCKTMFPKRPGRNILVPKVPHQQFLPRYPDKLQTSIQ